MKRLKYTALDPVWPKPIEVAYLTEEEFIKKYNEFPWERMLQKQHHSSDKDIYYSPSVGIEDEDGKGVCVSVVELSPEEDFYVCYNRPVMVKKRKWFWTKEYLDDNFCSIIPKQTKEEGLSACLCFFRDDLKTLEEKWG